MIAIAVVASLVVYAWVMGYIGYQTNNAGNSVVIQSVTFNSSPETINTIYLQNTGISTVTLNPFIFVNGQQTATTSIMVGSTATTSLPGGSTATITASALTNAGAVQLISGQTVTVKVTTTGGTYSQVTQQAP